MSLPENPYISPLRLPGPGERLRSAVSEAGSPYVGTGPVVTRPPHVTAESNVFKPTTSITPETGAFYGLFVEGGDTFLQGGTVTAGDGTEVVDAFEVLSGGSPVGTDGQHLVIRATLNGVVEDAVLLPGCNLTAVSTPSAETTVSDNTLPTAAASTGKYCYISLGVFTATAFLPARIGNIQIGFCPGTGYTVSRA
jgi:hypothetical protein